MNKTTLPRGPRGHSYCWAEHPQTRVHCTETAGHPPRGGNGGHWLPYTRTSW
jgi:hypothetical protein